MTEQKTKKTKRFMINNQLRQEIDKYIKNMAYDEYLFQSQKDNNNPITRVQAYRILSNAAAKIGLEEKGSHTLKKSFGFWHYKQYKDIALLQELFNHSALSVTLRYFSIIQDIMDKSISIEDFYL